MRMTNTLTAILACVMYAVALHAAEPATDEAASPSIRAGEQINWQVISSGGTDGGSENYVLDGTVGQTAVGSGGSETYILQSGYWQVFDYCCCSLRGDVNSGGEPDPDIADLIYMVTFMFQEGPEPLCMGNTDVNGDGTCTPDIADLIYLVTYMFQEGPALVPCP